MFCKKCGREISQGTLFCPDCGSRIDLDTVLSNNDVANPENRAKSAQEATAPVSESTPVSENAPVEEAAPAPESEPVNEAATEAAPAKESAPIDPTHTPGYSPTRGYINSQANNSAPSPTRGFTPNQSSTSAVPPKPDMPMGWFKFLIYFSLFAGGILNIISAFPMLTGTTYGSSEDAQLVYTVFEGIQTIDVIYGLLCIALGIFQIYTRFRLAGFHENGPKLLIGSYIGVVAINLFYYIGLHAVIPAEFMSEIDTGSIITSIITSAILAFINYSYFKKRDHLFINP